MYLYISHTNLGSFNTTAPFWRPCHLVITMRQLGWKQWHWPRTWVFRPGIPPKCSEGLGFYDSGMENGSANLPENSVGWVPPPSPKKTKKKREKVSRDPPRSWWRIQTEVFFLIERQKKRKFRSFEDVWIRDYQRIRLRFYPHHIPTIKNISKTGLLLRRHRVRSKPCLGIPTEKNWQMKKTGQQKRRFSNMFSFCDYDIIWLRSIESISIWNPYGYYDHIPTII